MSTPPDCSGDPIGLGTRRIAQRGLNRQTQRDAHGGMLRAIEARWPGAELHQCEWHLQHALERLLAKEMRNNPSEELEELRTRAEGALTGPSFWRPFVRAARAAENESLDRWIAVNDPIIERQFARRGRSSERPADMPLTTAALEQLARPITAALYPRRYALKNRERLNRLLMLLQLHVNGDDDVQGYAKTIRAWLEANGGRPNAQRRLIADPAGALHCVELSPTLCERGAPAYSPDGRHLAWVQGPEGLGEKSESHILIGNTQGRGACRLTNGSAPQFSPDGHSIVFTRNRRCGNGLVGSEISIRTLDTNQEWHVEQACGADLWAPTYSPDGAWIVYTIFDGERSQLAFAPVPGSVPSYQPLPGLGTDLPVDELPSWQPLR